MDINNSQSNSVFRFILVLIFIGFAFLLFYLYQTKSKVEKQQNFITVTPLPPVTLKMGTISLKTAADLSTGEVNKPLELDVIATSDKKSIVGYDVVVTFEEGSLEVDSAKSLLPDFDLYQVKKSDHYILTGTKKLDSIEPTLLDNTAIVRLRLVPKSKGEVLLTVVDRLGLEKSQMVDEETKVLLPKVGQIILEIQ